MESRQDFVQIELRGTPHISPNLRISRTLRRPWASKMPSWSLRGPPRSPWTAPLSLRNAVLEPPRASLVASDDSKAALRRLLATSDVILLPRKPFLTHFDLILKLLGPQKPMNSLRKTMIFTFASFPLPTRPRSPKRCPKSAQNDSQRLPRGAQELPRSPQEAPRGPQNHLRSAPGGPLGAKEASQGAFDSFTVSFSSLRDLVSSIVYAFSVPQGPILIDF